MIFFHRRPFKGCVFVLKMRPARVAARFLNCPIELWSQTVPMFVCLSVTCLGALAKLPLASAAGFCECCRCKEVALAFSRAIVLTLHPLGLSLFVWVSVCVCVLCCVSRACTCNMVALVRLRVNVLASSSCICLCFVFVSVFVCRPSSTCSPFVFPCHVHLLAFVSRSSEDIAVPCPRAFRSWMTCTCSDQLVSGLVIVHAC